MNKYLVFLLLLLMSPSAKADSTQVFSIRHFWNLLINNHPTVKQAALLNEGARQELRLARGAFDPSFSYTLDQKDYKDKDYYNYQQGVLKIPTWYAVDFKAGAEKNSGELLSPENSTGTGGISYAGVSVPLGQGLFIDQRRAALKQAKLLQNIADAEQVKILNKLLLEAAKNYWDWYFFYNKYQLQKNGFNLALTRLQMVNSRIRHGDMASIDSVEALLEVQRREVLMQDAWLELQNSRISLSAFLWSPELVPYELDSAAVPSPAGTEISPLNNDSLQQYLSFASSSHPEINKQNFKIRQLEIERKLRRELLKPSLNLSMNVLDAYPDYSNTFNPSTYAANNKFGVDFYMPLFLRKERAKYQLAGVKLQQERYDLLLISRNVNNGVLLSYNELNNLQKLLVLQENSLLNYRALLLGEQRKFENGESTVFLINQRERALLENEVKYRELQAKYAKSKVMLWWSTGKRQLGIF